MALRRFPGWLLLSFGLLVVLGGCQFNHNYSEGYGNPKIDVTPLPGLPASASLVSASFSDSQHGWAVAANCPATGAAACRGLFFRTADGGQNWVSTLPTLLTPRKVQFADATNGWFIGSIGQNCGSQVCPNEIMMSTDGGQQWERASAVNVELIDLSVVSPSNVWVLGRLCPPGANCHATLATTDSAGQLWANQDLPLLGSDFGLQRLDAKTAWVVALQSAANAAPSAQPRLVATVDGGATWSTAASPCPGREQSFDFRSAADGWLFCSVESGIQLYVTSDGAKNWQKAGLIETSQSAAPSGDAVRGVTRLSATEGVVALSDGTIEVTSDGGKSWAARLRAGEPLHAVARGPGHEVWVLGRRHVYRTTDSGQTWATNGLDYHPAS